MAQTAMQGFIVHLEMLKSRVDMVDVNSLIEYATNSLEKEKEQIKYDFTNGQIFPSLKFEEYYTNEY